MVKYYKKAERVMKFVETIDESWVEPGDIVAKLSRPVQAATSSRFAGMLCFSYDFTEVKNVLD